MPTTIGDNLFAFIWRPEETDRTLTDIARHTNTTVIVDGRAGLPSAEELDNSGVTDIILSLDDFMSPDIGGYIKRANIGAIWTEYHPALGHDVEEFSTRIQTFEPDCRIIPVCVEWESLETLCGIFGPDGMVAIKGSEASGLVGGETAGVLFSTLLKNRPDVGQRPQIMIWGGVGTPEAAAAFLVCGAKGVVFESLHWLTDMVQVEETVKDRLAKLRPEQTSVAGAETGIFFRFFDKGNSRALKELREYSTSLGKGGATGQAATSFIRRVSEISIHALESDLGPGQAIPLGPEAAFASRFVERFGSSTSKAISGFLTEVGRLLQDADQTCKKFTDSPCARELGVRYPFIQGGMSWITDVPEFALAVSEGGGLPTVALGMRDRGRLEKDLNRLKDQMAGRPYALNVIVLPENPCREEQLQLIEEMRPPFVVIAAGDPTHASRLLKKGIDIIYVAADEGLMKLALKEGVRWVVLEGHEAGGHVGEMSTLILAQTALELKRRDPGLFENKFIALAGGIYNRQTAVWAAMLGADAVQMGTVYLSTREIVETGALSALFQRVILEAGPSATTISGQSVGLRIRAVKTPKVEAIVEIERNAGGGDEIAFRQKLETLSAGSLLIAARGLDGPDGAELPEETCLKEGQFMSGAAAGAIDRVTTVAELHGELAGGEAEIATRPRSTFRSAGPAREKERVAITGWSLVNSLGNNPDEIWDGVLAGRCGIVDVPPSRWDHSVYFDPKPGTPEKTYCRFGAFINLDISRKQLRIPPQDFRTMSEATRLTMYLAHHALNDSGILDSDIPRERIGVIISQNSGESASTMGDLVLNVTARDLVTSLRQVFPMTPEQEEEAQKVIKAGRLVADDTTLVGRLSCTAGGFICNKYGFMGPSYAVTAACATSQVAMYSAIQLMRNGIIDAAIVGGGEEKLTPAHFVEFSALGSLAGISGVPRQASECSRPFDYGRDGMVLGEGGGMIVIERESVARKRGARVRAYITGLGASNNDRGMVESLAETQQLAVKASFQDSGGRPDDVDLVECHATGTVQGDLEEVKALKSFFPKGKKTVLTSFKSQIGHTLGASGVNNLVRGIMALNSGIYPATLSYDNPDPRMNLEECGFSVLKQPEEWTADRPRRMMLNAFGFGGANYVVQVEENREDRDAVLVKPPVWTQLPEPMYPGELAGVSMFTSTLDNRPYRLGVTASGDVAAQRMIDGLDPLDGPPTEKWMRARVREGIFVHPSDRPMPAAALVCAGQGTYYTGMGKELYQTFPEVASWMDRMAALADFDLLGIMFDGNDAELKNTLHQQPALFCLEYAVARQLMALGFEPAAAAGHSIGEITALALAEALSWEDAFRLVMTRARLMDRAADLTADPGAMIATNAPLDFLQDIVTRRNHVYFTNYNSPSQVVLGGGTSDVLALKTELDGAGHRSVQLKVSMAFHSPLMKTIREDMEAAVSRLDFNKPRIPVISNATMKPYPDDPQGIRENIVNHLESPVHWMQGVESLWNDFGIRHFVELGPKSTMCNLIGETLDGASCVETCRQGGEAKTLRSSVARLYSLGHIPVRRSVAHVSFPSSVRLERGPAVTSAPAPAPAPVTTSVPNSVSEKMQAVIQREINSFLLDSFGRFLKPALVEAVRREVDPAFDESGLDHILGLTPSASAAMPIPRPMPAAAPRPVPIEPAAAPKTTPSRVPEQPAMTRVIQTAIPPASTDGVLEQVIRIIMDATGYEREEIEPDMDIRSDLAIRSSRLPVIMDAAEHQFGITINLEDFIGLRTVRELADRIEEVASRNGNEAPAKNSVFETPMESPLDSGPAPVAPVSRVEIQARPVQTSQLHSENEAHGADSGETDYLEQVIRIIMDATGYERDEIEPDMDIRSDLAIRSSRLPVIMDAAEKQFGITINIEDFIGLQTVRDLGDRIAQVAGGKPAGEHQVSAVTDTAREALAPAAIVTEKPAEPVQNAHIPLKRFVFNLTPVDGAVGTGLVLPIGHQVAVLTFDEDTDLTKEIVGFIQKRLRGAPVVVNLAREVDLQTRAGAKAAVDKLKDMANLAGLVMIMDESGAARLDGPENAASFQAGFFQVLQTLMRSGQKRTCLLVTRGLNDGSIGRVAAEGMLGMCLAAAHEYASVLFKAVDLDKETETENALTRVWDEKNRLVQWIFRNDQAFAVNGENRSAPAGPIHDGLLEEGSVVVFSGGGRGVTPYLAKALAPFNVRPVLMGRSRINLPEGLGQAAVSGEIDEAGIKAYLQKVDPDLKGGALEKEVTRVRNSIQVIRTLNDFAREGREAEYYPCDVTDAKAVGETMKLIKDKYGRIDGVVHGAGLIRDSFFEFMSVEDFNQVMAVKLAGAWNLYRAGLEHGLRFMVAMSSVSGVQGNAGQVNYSAANRSMAALLRMIASWDGVRTKTLMLPPVEGAGMADDPEVKELFKLKGMSEAYAHAEEVGEFFCRELMLGPEGENEVMLARILPDLETVRLDLSALDDSEDELTAQGVRFNRSRLPMIDSILEMDLKNRTMTAGRTFSTDRDPWLGDHIPFHFMKHPLVSAIMASETFLEASDVLYPHLTPVMFKDVEFTDILETPVGRERESRITCRRLSENAGRVSCGVTLEGREVNTRGEPLDRWSTCYRGQVILAGHRPPLPPWDQAPVDPSELDTKPLDKKAIIDWYEKVTRLTGRYRVLEKCYGTGENVISGYARAPKGSEFADLQSAEYRFPVYVLEALLQTAGFFRILRTGDDSLTAIPFGFSELWLGVPVPENGFHIEARQTAADDLGMIWDARAFNDDGESILEARGLQVRWYKA